MSIPPCAPRRTGTLPRGDGHVLAWQEFGAADGKPALVLHGGPGSSLTPALVRCFDFGRWRVIGFDQRGCGASTPRGATAHNDTAHLLRDIEAVRRFFALQRWTIVGGSWGATLALAYAAQHPEAVDALVLRGLFVPDAEQLRWFFEGASTLADLAQGNALVPWLADVFAHGDPALQSRVALAWWAWEQARAGETAQAPADLQAVMARYRVQSHYLAHHCWLGDGALHAAARRLPRLPVHFLHGAGDRVCRPAAAQAVHGLVAGSRFTLVPHAGHDPMHPAMASAMQAALSARCEGGRR